MQDYVCCAVGTGGTLAGIINSASERQKVIGFPVIKGFSKLEKDLLSCTKRRDYSIVNDYFFGGYAKLTD